MKTLISLILLTIPTLSQAEKVKSIEVNFDKYFAKIKIKNTIVNYQDPQTNHTVHIDKCNRSQWSTFIANLSAETRDFELLVNTRNPAHDSDDILYKKDQQNYVVPRNTSLGKWLKNIEGHWQEFALHTQETCIKSY